jgi:hypothetical protein
MSSTRIVAVLGVVVVFLALILAPVTPTTHAQGPNDGGRPRDESQSAVSEEVDDSKLREAGTADEVGGQGLIDPTPAGFTMLYMFSGARHRTALGSQVATVVHCTNYGSEAAAVRVEVFDWDNDAGATFSGEINVLPNRTQTFSTANTQVYVDNVVMTQPVAEPINQGSGRVLSDKDTIICTAQVIDPAHAWPYFAVKLALHYPNGTPVSAYYVASAHLPVILREASPEP